MNLINIFFIDNIKFNNLSSIDFTLSAKVFKLISKIQNTTLFGDFQPF